MKQEVKYSLARWVVNFSSHRQKIELNKIIYFCTKCSLRLKIIYIEYPKNTLKTHY